MAYSKLNRSDLNFEKKIGAGSFSTVYQAKCCGNLVAVKKLYKVHDDELAIMSQLQHENIVRLLGVVDEEPDFYLILELCSGGSLRDYLDTYEFERLPKDKFYDWAKQAAKPIEYLKKHGVVHKDIKSANYVICSENTLKLTDFGLSKKIEQTMSNATGRGTYGYMSPELMKSVILSTTYDIFSYGVVVWELWTTEVPFKEEPYYVIVWKVCHDNEHLPIPADCPEPIANMMGQCWQADWKARPDVSEILAVVDEAIKAEKENTNHISVEQKTCTEDQSGEQHRSLHREIIGTRNKCKENDKNRTTFDEQKIEHYKMHQMFCQKSVNLSLLPLNQVKANKPVTISKPVPDISLAEELMTSYQSKIFQSSWKPARQIGESGPYRGPRGITTTTSGDFAVAYKLSQRFVCVFSEIGDIKFKLDTKIHNAMPTGLEPWDVVMSSDNIYYVTDKTPYVKMFRSTDGFCIGQWVTKSPLPWYMNEMAQDKETTVSLAESIDSGLRKSLPLDYINGKLKGLAINSRDQLYVGDIKHKYISKHSKDGTHIMSFRAGITPRSLAVTSHETIVVSDWFETKSVLLLNTSGQCLQVIEPRSISPPDWIPQGITCHQDVICVCNFANTKIYCFTDHGDYLGPMSLDTPQYPRCLAFSADGNKFYVVFGHNPLPCHGIAIYERK